jgi:signal transduction histidine kinase
MLMLIKKQNEPCIALFMDWEILDNFNLFLNELNIPMKEFTEPGGLNGILTELLNDFKKNLQSGDWSEHSELAERIAHNIDGIQLPGFLKPAIVDHLLLPDSHGTYFFVFDPHEQLLHLSPGGSLDVPDDSLTNYLRSSLSGVYDGFSENKDIRTHFWIHESKGRYDIISQERFFTEEDIYSADHWVNGEFNAEGFFTGEVQIFNQIVKHTFRPRHPPGLTPYGPFKIKFGTIEGNEKSSKLSEEQWLTINNKLKVFGGLYIYRDKFRVLPYGRPEFDFLAFEERRSKGAGYYFFSHRRMLGMIDISREANPKLNDKAGREGLIRNKAYNEFVEDLKSFFIDLSIRYFKTATSSENLTPREQQINAIRKQNERILKLEKKRARESNTRFNRELKNNAERLDNLLPELEQLQERLQAETQKTSILYNTIEAIFEELENKKIEIKKLKVTKPKTFKMTDRQKNKLYYYNQKLDETLVIIDRCNTTAREVSLKLSKEYLLLEFNRKSEQLKKDLSKSLSQYKRRFLESAGKLELEINDDQQAFEDLFDDKTSHLVPTGNEDKEELEQRLTMLGKIYEAIKEEIEDKYAGFMTHVESLTFGIDDDLLMGWYKEQYEKIEEKVEAMQELAQLGVAIEIIDHQFNVLYSEMAHAIDFFRKFSGQHKGFKENFRQLKESFQHLEKNHQLLVPLYRTTRRVKKEIWGKDIIGYMKTFFRKNLRKYRVELTSDRSFDNYSIYSYESVIKAVFINILDNALFWLYPVKERKIHMAYEDGKILIMNSGEPIEPAYREEIFKLFFTRKSDGRGIGLYLARLNLRSVGYDIYCELDKKYNRLKGACFVIEPFEKRSAEE